MCVENTLDITSEKIKTFKNNSASYTNKIVYEATLKGTNLDKIKKSQKYHK